MFFKLKFLTKNVLPVKRMFLWKIFLAIFLRIFFANKILLNSLPTTDVFPHFPFFFLFLGGGGGGGRVDGGGNGGVISVLPHCVEKFGKYIFSEVTLYANGSINSYK